MQAQVGPRELDVLPMPKAAAGSNDLLEDLGVGSTHAPTVAAATAQRKLGSST
jgi:hypothetical protein